MDPLPSPTPKKSSVLDAFPRRDTPESRASRRSGHERRDSTLDDHYHTEDVHLHYPPKRRAWHTRPQSPNLKWYKEYSPTSLKHGRILVIDYVKQDLTTKGKRKVTSQEIDDVEGLRKIYSNVVRGNEAILRVFHVQNGSPECVDFLLQKFNINAQDDLVGLDFDRYLNQKLPGRNGRKPVLSGKTWKTQHDPWRGLSKTAFGIDYFKAYRTPDPADKTGTARARKIMELECLDHNDMPCYGWDVHVQRLSCYVQHKESATDALSSPALRAPYLQSFGPGRGRDRFYHTDVGDFDNGNAILIFEESQSGSIEDTIIPFRRHIESRWRRLPFYLAFESHEVLDDDQMSLECSKIIMEDIWMAVAEVWEDSLDLFRNHVGILLDKIYENPANESLAPSLWTNSDYWLSAERLISIHVNVVRECQVNLLETSDKPDIQWLETIPSNFQRLSNLIQEDLVKPTAGLTDLMYKSVGIRDARHSLELNLSLFRLSWVTFMFLPLTFLCGFFSMQVDMFASTPSVKWYFIAAVPMMLAVFSSWFLFKRFSEGATQSPYTRGVYEQLFQDMAASYPRLWTREGPLYSARLRSGPDRLKWWLIKRWSSPQRTGNVQTAKGESIFDGLGSWSRFKRHMMKRWTAQIQTTDILLQSTSPELGAIALEADNQGLFQGKLGDPAANAELKNGNLQVPFNLNQRVSIAAESVRRSSSAGRRNSKDSSAGRNSGVMEEEERLDWLENP